MRQGPSSSFDPIGRSRGRRIPGITRVRTDRWKRHDLPISALPGPSGYAVATEWIGRLAAVLAIVLLAMVLTTIHKVSKCRTVPAPQWPISEPPTTSLPSAPT